MGKHGKTFYGRLTALKPDAVKHNKNLKGCLWKQRKERKATQFYQLSTDTAMSFEMLHTPPPPLPLGLAEAVFGYISVNRNDIYHFL